MVLNSDRDDVVVSVRGLRKDYGQIAAVDGIDLEVRRGEIFALLGPNGAGKTTTVEILEGYRRRTAGDVTVLGCDPGEATREWRDRVGLVLQSSKVADEVSVTEIIDHFSRCYATPRSTAEVIDLVGLTEKRTAKVSKLSGGQQRRLDVALGIVGHPELLFLDEPTTGFDPEARRQFWSLIERLRDEGTTVLLTTHYLDEAEHLADRVGVMAGGRMIEIAEPAVLGGRLTADTVVSWTDPDGTERQQATSTPTALVAELSGRFGGEIPGLRVMRPTLEDIYLQMIGATHV